MFLGTKITLNFQRMVSEVPAQKFWKFLGGEGGVIKDPLEKLQESHRFSRAGRHWQRKLQANFRSSCSVKNPWAVCKWTATIICQRKRPCHKRTIFGYSKNSSTIAALLKAVDEWKWAKDKGLIFDVIDHSLLLQKLKANAISGAEHAWFFSYLTNRKQFVQCNGVNSNERSLRKNSTLQKPCESPVKSCFQPCLCYFRAVNWL